MKKKVNFGESIRNSLHNNLSLDKNIFILGLGADYPNGADGTHKGLSFEFPERVLDTPTSEAALTGLAVGAAASGLRPIVHHGRVEFALFAADQIFTQAAKWNDMFGGDYPCPIYLRICIGRQWGNGPQHTQSLLGLFGNCIGLEVLFPYNPQTASDYISYQRVCSNPVVFLESRWLYKTQQSVILNNIEYVDGVDVILDEGDTACVAIGEGIQEVLRARQYLKNIDSAHELSVIAITKINPFPSVLLSEHLNKFCKIIIFDTYNSPFGFSHECYHAIKSVNENIEIIIITSPHLSTPISPVKAASFYPTFFDILQVYSSIKKIDVNFCENRTVRELSLPPEFNFDEIY